MGFSPLADMSQHIPDQGRSSPRNSAVTGLGLHHNAGVDSYDQASAAGREVSANYWIANNGDLIPNVDESRRAWTSGHPAYPAGAAADHRNITVEISNSPEGVRDGTWAISAAARKTLIALTADVYRRYNLGPVKRGAEKGVGVHRDWVQTECPGGYVMDELPSIIAEAETLRTKNTAASKPTVNNGSPEEDDMNYIWIKGKTNARRGGLYAVIGGKKAIFLGGPAPAGVPSVTDEARIAELQKHISGLA